MEEKKKTQKTKIKPKEKVEHAKKPCNGAETFLPRSVPDLKLDNFLGKRERSTGKVDPDGGAIAGGKGVVGESLQQGRFAASRLANQQKLEEPIIGL